MSIAMSRIPRTFSSPAGLDRAYRTFLVLFTAAFLTLLALRPGGAAGMVWFSDITLSVSTVAAGTFGLIFAFRMEGAGRRSWILMSLGTLSWAAGIVTWSIYELVLGRDPFPSPADVGYLGMIPLMVAGLVSLPVGQVPRDGRVKVLVDAVLVMACIATFSWYIVLGPISSQAEIAPIAKAISLAYPAGDVILICALLFGVARGWVTARDPVVIPLVAGLGLFVVADLGFNYLTLHGAYVSGSPIDLGWPLGFLFVSYASLRRWAHGADRVETPAVQEPSRVGGLAPYVMVIAVALLLFFSRMNVRNSEQNILVILCLVSVGLALARQYITLRENESLNRRLKDFSHELEDTVEQRTVRLAALHQVGAALSAASDATAQAFLDTAKLVGQTLGVEYVAVLELSKSERRLSYLAGEGWGEGPARSELRVSAAREAGYTLKRQEAVITLDVATEDRFVSLDVDRARGIASGAAVPITVEGHRLGVLTAHSREPRAFTEDDIHFLQSVTSLLGPSLVRIRADDELRRQHAATTAQMIALAQAQEELEKSRDEAERANRAKSEFLSRMSHELRTPLNAVLGFSQLLQIDDTMSTEQGEYVEYIMRSGRHLLRLIDEVLDISRIEAGRLSLSVEPFDIDQLVREVLEMTMPLAAERSITVTVAEDRPNPGSLQVLADVQRTKQALLNLVSNGIKYNHSGGSVAIAATAGTDGEILIEVRDTGVGIDPAKRDRLFAPFDRLDAENMGVEGTGLGLALSRALVEAMDGSLSVESELGAGSTFAIRLPMAAGRVLALPSGASIPTPSDRPVMVYVEDNFSNFGLVERAIGQRLGVKVIAGKSGADALDLAQTVRPAVLLMDYHLSDLTGIEVLKILKSDASTASMPVVITSADVSSGVADRALSAGAHAFVPKPIDISELTDIVRRIVTAEEAKAA